MLQAMPTAAAMACNKPVYCTSFAMYILGSNTAYTPARNWAVAERPTTVHAS